MLGLIELTTVVGFMFLLLIVAVKPVREVLLNLDLEEYFEDGDTTGISYNIIHLMLFAIWLITPVLNLALVMLLLAGLFSVIILVAVDVVARILKLEVDDFDAWIIFVLLFIMITIIKPLTIICNHVQPAVDKLFRKIRM